jgi:hypothetical protein
LHHDVVINHIANNGGDHRVYYDTNDSSYHTLSNGEENFKVENRPVVASLTTSVNVLMSQPKPYNDIFTDDTSKVLVYPLHGENNTNRKSIMIKPIGMDSFVIEYPDFNKYVLELVAYNDIIQNGVKIREIKSYSDFYSADSDIDSGKIRIDKTNFLSIMASVTQAHDTNHYHNTVTFNTVRFRLRDKNTGAIGKLSRFGIVYENLHQYNTFRFMIKNFD